MYYDDFDVVNLVNAYCRCVSRLQTIGPLYDGAPPVRPASPAQVKAIEYNRDGYDFGEQIFDLYAEQGAIMQAMQNLVGYFSVYENDKRNGMIE